MLKRTRVRDLEEDVKRLTARLAQAERLLTEAVEDPSNNLTIGLLDRIQDYLGKTQ